MISNKCNYALRAMLELAKREGRGPVTIMDIAEAQNIPARFLEAILRQLKQAGLTESIRGKKGGYVLSRSSREISMGEVIRLIEGPFFAGEWTATQGGVGRADVFTDIWIRADESLAQVYDAVSFRELAARDNELASRFVANYTI